MPQDYKGIRELKQRLEPVPLRQRLSYFGSGLAIGLGLTFVVYLREHQPPQPQVQYWRQAEREQREARQKVERPQRDTSEFALEFYTILPEMEVRLPDSAPPPRRPADEQRQDERSGPYLLQIGSFREPRQAEKQRQWLRSKGIDAGIQTVRIGPQPWYRVRLGPYSRQEDLEEARSQLRRHGIDFLSLLQKEPSGP